MAQCYHISSYYTALAIAAEKKRQCELADRFMAISTQYLNAANGRRQAPWFASYE